MSPKMEQGMLTGNFGKYSKNIRFKSIGNLRGFTFIGLLIVIAIAGIGLAAVGILWKTEMQREHEKELLFVGNEFKKAITSYYSVTQGGIGQLPKTIDELILDKRLPMIKHHLRKLYLDPMTGQPVWGIDMYQGGIIGIHSLSKSKPIKKYGFDVGQEEFANATSYLDWHFTFRQGG
jgi:type II secretory pathway pseudopilin PulG